MAVHTHMTAFLLVVVLLSPVLAGPGLNLGGLLSDSISINVNLKDLIAAATSTCNANTKLQARHGLSSAQYQAFYNQNKAGYTIKTVSGYPCTSNKDRVCFAALYVAPAPTVATIARHALPLSQYQAEFDANVKAGYRLVFTNPYSIPLGLGVATYFNTYWVKDASTAWRAVHNRDATQYQADFNKAKADGYRLTWISGYATGVLGGVAKYAAVFTKTGGPAWAGVHNVNSDQYQAKFNELNAQGYRPVVVNGFRVGAGGQDMYTAVFEKSSAGGWVARHRLPLDNYQCDFDNQMGSGYRLAHVSGYDRAGTANFATVWVADSMDGNDIAAIDTLVAKVMSDNDVPGLSIAISQAGRPVFAKGYGSRSIPADYRSVCPDSRFRIASLSKQITATAIYKLLDQGRLSSIDRTVFGTGGILGNDYGTELLPNGSKSYSARARSITVRHLLQHVAGGPQWDNRCCTSPDSWSDPMFDGGWINQAQGALITSVLDSRTLTNNPGASNNYAYSNFGYCVIGRIIEKLTGKSYTRWVYDNVLAAVGARGFLMGTDTAAQRLPREVQYRTGPTESGNPYGMKVARMDAHGGWVATALDLIYFARSVDGYSEGAVDQIRGSSWTTMHSGSAANSGYASGIALCGGNSTCHNGILPGCYTYMWRGWSTDPLKRYTVAVLTNTRGSDKPSFQGDVTQLAQDIIGIAGIDKRWPCSLPLAPAA